jgi:hypothetical protein
MADSPQTQYDRWKLDECLAQHSGLRIVPSADDTMRLRGELAVHATGPDGVTIADTFLIELAIPHTFPPDIPTAREMAGRIPPTFHKLDGDCFCLGAPTALRITLATSLTILTFLNRLVIPYLYGFAYFERFGKMPFDELDHGPDGIRQHFAELFGLTSRVAAQEMVRLASLRKRVANKAPCPCRSGERLGRCHHLIVNRLRTQLGRRWFRTELQHLVQR